MDNDMSSSISFVLLSSALVFLMTPGVGILYSGLSSSKNALHIFILCMLSYVVVTIQWVMFGFSLAFSETGSSIIGDFNYIGMKNIGLNVMSLTAPQVPSIVFALYQLQFATVTVAIIFGATVERIKIFPALCFMFIWTTLVYDPVTYWTWGARGWIKNMSCLNTLTCGIGGIDFAGGGPVHISSGFSALAYAYMLGKRNQINIMNHNIINVFIGTGLLWFGWLGFNGSSALSANARAAMAMFVTTISASSGALTWVCIDVFRFKKFSGISFCCGALSGLIGITPCAGYVAPWASIIIGSITSICCCFGLNIKNTIGIDDTLDAFGIHGIGGLVGSILCGIFAQKFIGDLDGSILLGGMIDGNYIQILYQLFGAIAIALYSFIVTLLIIFCLKKVCKISLSNEEVVFGGDYIEMGEINNYM